MACPTFRCWGSLCRRMSRGFASSRWVSSSCGSLCLVAWDTVASGLPIGCSGAGAMSGRVVRRRGRSAVSSFGRIEPRFFVAPCRGLSVVLALRSDARARLYAACSRAIPRGRARESKQVANFVCDFRLTRFRSHAMLRSPLRKFLPRGVSQRSLVTASRESEPCPITRPR
jgi:hypothetical protein